mmetsp:Transcript_11448/g.15627  ORF Transcript_11448/g.15627 Transcript_11448/m.15627 type:complete len:147 (-) Transcript_11448:32-472(-)
MKNDHDIVIAAVTHNGMALQFASNELKNDKNIVLTALRETGYALVHSSFFLKNDPKVVETAIKNSNCYVVQYAGPGMIQNKIVQAACHSMDENWVPPPQSSHSSTVPSIPFFADTIENIPTPPNSPPYMPQSDDTFVKPPPPVLGE